jgi:hypothetical protein
MIHLHHLWMKLEMHYNVYIKLINLIIKKNIYNIINKWQELEE